MSRIYIQDYGHKKKPYLLVQDISYMTRYGKSISITKAEKYRSDGATGAYDINSRSWWFHDYICDFGVFDDGSKCSNWQASVIIKDVLLLEDKWFRAHTWFVMTFLFGGGKARENGMFSTK